MKIIKYLIVLFLVTFSLVESQAQQDTRYSQYMFNGLRLNPAYAGTKDGLSLNALYRNQWVRIEDAPKSILLSAHDKFGKKGKEKKVGLGMFLEYDQAGVDSRTSVYAAYSYRFKMGETGYLSAGLQGGFVFHQAILTDVITPEEVYDEAFSQNENYMLPNFGAGLYYYNDKSYIGFSIPHLIGYERFSQSTQVGRLRGAYREYLVTAGTSYKLNENVVLKPSLLIKYIPAQPPVEFDINISALIKETVWLGMTLRSNEVIKPESVNFQIAYQGPKGLHIGYAYDHMLKSIGYYTSGAHEVMVGFNFPSKDPLKAKTKSPNAW